MVEVDMVWSGQLEESLEDPDLEAHSDRYESEGIMYKVSIIMI
jgi:hypothetical protein